MAGRDTTLLTMSDAKFQHSRPFWWSLVAQLVAYAILIALCALSDGTNIIPGSTAFPWTILAVVPMIVLLPFFSPLRDGIPGRIIAVICGWVAVFFAMSPRLGDLIFVSIAQHDRDADMADFFVMPQAWLAGVGVLLIALLVCGFIRQMARKDRKHLILQMSQMILDGVCAIAASGWCFLPSVWRLMRQPRPDSLSWVPVTAFCAVIVCAIAMGVVSALWHRDVEPLHNARAPWLGIGLMPVMLTGASVGIAALCASLW